MESEAQKLLNGLRNALNSEYELSNINRIYFHKLLDVIEVHFKEDHPLNVV